MSSYTLHEILCDVVITSHLNCRCTDVHITESADAVTDTTVTKYHCHGSAVTNAALQVK